MRCVSILLASLALAAPAHAVDLVTLEQLALQPAKAEGWIVSVGGAAQFGPRYLGAAKAAFSGLPSLSLRRIGEAADFSAPDDSFDVTLWSDGAFGFGPVANLRAGRYPSTDRRLTGLDKSPSVIEPGVFVDYWVIKDQLRLRAELRHGLNQHEGFTLALGSDWITKLDRFTFSFGPRVQVFDAPLARRLYGVTPKAALANAFVTPFRPSGGIGTIGAAAAVSYDWNDAWRTTPYLRYDRLVGDAARSPIVRRLGEHNQFSVGVGATYSFAVTR